LARLDNLLLSFSEANTHRQFNQVIKFGICHLREKERESLLCTCGLGLCAFSGLACDLLSSSLYVRALPDGALPKSISSHTCDVHCLEDTRVTWCLSYPSGGPPFSRRYVSL